MTTRMVRATLLLVLLLSATLVAGSVNITGSWANRNYPMPRSQAAAACDDNFLYMYGGQDDFNNYMADFWMYDRVTNLWTAIFPGGSVTPAAFSAMGVVGANYTYLVGGVDQLGHILSQTVRYLPDNNYWEVVPEQLPQPTPRHGHQIIPDGVTGFYMLFGLTPQMFLNDIWHYDYVNNSWTLVVDVDENSADLGVITPEPRYGTCCDVDPQFTAIYCFGGLAVAGEQSDFWAFNLTSHKWVELTPQSGETPPPRFFGVCGFVDGGFLTGLGADSQHQLVQDLWFFNFSTGLWEDRPKPPIAREYATGCTIGNTLLITGGVDGNSSMSSNALLTFVVEDNMWHTPSPDYFLPFARSAAVAARVSDQVYVAWGRSVGYSTMTDIWSYDLVLNQWNLELFYWMDEGADYITTGKIGASWIERGPVVWIFAGLYTDNAGDEFFTNDITAMDTTNGSNRLYTLAVQGSPPSLRAFPASMRIGDEMVVFGGFDVYHNELGDLWAYYPELTDWLQIVVVSAAQPVAKAAAKMVLLPNGTVVLVGGSVNGEEKWALNLNLAARPPTASWFLMEDVFPSDRSTIDFQRLDAVVMGIGYHIVICGGATTETAELYGTDNACFEYDAHIGVNTPVQVDQNFVPTMDSAATYVANTLVILGGAVFTDSVARTDVAAVVQQTWTINMTSICNSSSVVDNTCMYCSLGSYYDDATGNCLFVPAGYYLEDPTQPSQACPLGTFAPRNGTTADQGCIPCDEGSYAPANGSSTCFPCPTDHYCPMAAAHPYPLDVTAVAAGITALNIQPSPYTKGSVPITVYEAFSAAAAASAVFVTVVLLTQRFLQWKLQAHYLGDDVQETIKKNYVWYDPLNRGIDQQELILLLLDLGFHCTDEDAEKLLLQFDAKGVRRLFVDDVMALAAFLAEAGKLHIKSVHADGTTSAEPTKEELNPVVRAIGLVRLKALDMFSTQHGFDREGNPTSVTKNTWGGIMTILFIIGSVLLAVELIMSFQFENIFETRGTVPRVVESGAIVTDFRIELYTTATENPEKCVASAEVGVEGPCANGNITTQFVIVNGTSTMTCKFAAPRACSIIWTCSGCQIYSSAASVTLELSDPDWFADFMQVIFDVPSGIEGTGSHGVLTFAADPNMVFKGLPGCIAYAELTPTLFTTPNGVWDATTTTTSGYHVRFLPGSSTQGNQIDYSMFQHVFRVPVTVSLIETQDTLLVTRVASQTPIMLISMVLGSIPGFLTACAFVVALMDAAVMKAIEQNEKTTKVASAVPVGKERAVVDKYLQGLLRADMSYAAARAMLGMVQRVAQDVRDGNDEMLNALPDLNQSMSYVNTGENGASQSLERKPTWSRLRTSNAYAVHEMQSPPVPDPDATQ